MDKSSQVKNPSLEDYIQQNYIKATEIKKHIFKNYIPNKIIYKESKRMNTEFKMMVT